MLRMLIKVVRVTRVLLLNKPCVCVCVQRDQLPTVSGQTLTIEHILLECTVLQQNRDEYYTVDSLRTLFETIPEACIIEFLREAVFFYLIWKAIYPSQLFIQISHQMKLRSQVELIPTTEHHHRISFIDHK